MYCRDLGLTPIACFHWRSEGPREKELRQSRGKLHEQEAFSIFKGMLKQIFVKEIFINHFLLIILHLWASAVTHLHSPAIYHPSPVDYKPFRANSTTR